MMKSASNETVAPRLIEGLHQILIFCTISCAIILFSHCKDNQERPEQINSLRALGVEQTPNIAIPNETVKLKFYLAGQPSLTITPELQIDKAARYSLPAELTASALTLTETVVGPLSYYTFEAEFVSPSSEIIQTLSAKFGFAKIRYNVKFSSVNGEEIVVGDTLVTDATQRNDNTLNPEASITKPEATSSGNKIALDAAITNKATENYRVSWFVSSGTVTNRRAISTFWENPNPGAAAVFLTVRDLKSGYFAFKAKEVQVNGD